MTAYIPSPDQGVWRLGPLPLRAYAMFILAGIIVAVWLTQRRLAERGGKPGQALDVAVWAVPFGIVGGRLYHVISSPQAYFGDGGHPLKAFAIWEGGLGIWGAVALGTLGAWIGCRRHGVSFLDFADSAAPGVVLAQAIGRWGNYFNNELYGAKTDLPWGLRIYCWDQGVGAATTCPGSATNIKGIFQPTFLYESLWCLVIAVALLLLDRRLTFAKGQIFALYGMLYTIGRGVIEMLRTDDANYILGLRLNVWTSVIVFSGAAFAYWRLGSRTDDSSGREDPATVPPAGGEPGVDAGREPGVDAGREPGVDEEHTSQHPD